MIQFATSMMVANPFRLETDIKVIDHHTDVYHVDIMDGHYVPNIAQSLDFVKQLKPYSTRPIEAHLMVENAEKFIDQLIESGVHTLIIHPATILEKIDNIRLKCVRNGVRFGIAINPDETIYDYEDILEEIDVLTLMMVTPGFAGQSLVEEAVKNITEARDYKAKKQLNYLIEIDGSNNFNTFEKYIKNGAERLILGSTLFKYTDLNQGYQDIKAHIVGIKP